MSSKKQGMRHLNRMAKTYRVSRNVTDRAVIDILEALDCPRALTVALCYRYGEHRTLTELEVSPSDYFSLKDFRDAYAATALLSKASFLETGLDLKAEAMLKFKKFELQCRQTNARFRNLCFEAGYSGHRVWLLNAVTRKVQRILGELSIQEIFDHANWGPGVSTLLKGEDVSATNKFQLETGTTRDLYALLPLDGLPYDFPIWQRHLLTTRYPTFQVGNRVVTVPKDAKADRVIAIEPGLNLWFQKGIGSVIRKRLKRCGIDLNTQERNQLLARKGSKDSSLASVDFSSASDSISLGLIREVLPPDWFRLMDSCRSHYGIHNDVPTRWEKFSSMGNGFTFELESLIFYAAADATAELLHSNRRKEISVYGDDVIIPVDCYELFSSFCEFLGFTVNQRKSFASGPFRESCGKHFYDGFDITPIYIKEIVSSVSTVFRLANAIRSWSHRRVFKLGCDSLLRKSWIHLVRIVPFTLRFKGSLGLGDGAFISNWDESHCVRARDGIEGYYSTALVETGVTRYADSIGLLLSRLRTLSHQEYGNYYTLRGRTRLSIKRLLVRQWYDLGPWV